MDAVCTNELLNIIGILKLILRVLQIAIPIGLLIFGTIDLGKAVIAGEDKKVKEAVEKRVNKLTFGQNLMEKVKKFFEEVE